MTDETERDLLHEWRRAMDALVSSATSMAGRAELPRQLREPMQRQVELAQEILARERRIQAQLTHQVLAPVDAVFDLLAESGATLRRQAEALQAAGRALEETAALMQRQAELFEQTLGAVRRPTEIAKSLAGGMSHDDDRDPEPPRSAD